MGTHARDKRRIEFGDWQTPLKLAREVVAHVRELGVSPASILEPTCGQGAFLRAAAEAMPACPALGFDINPAYITEARRALSGLPVALEVHDFFRIPWEERLRELAEPILVLGNPPWVTSAELGVIGSENLPAKSNFKRLTGLDAITGKSNFDVSEWMILRLLAALEGRRFFLAMLCKSSVARRIMEHAAEMCWPIGAATYRIDARSHFNAAVDAVLLTAAPASLPHTAGALWPVFDSLSHKEPSRTMAVIDGITCSDVSRFQQTRHLEGACRPEWRSGIKHDNARVMELRRDGSTLVNALGERVEIEQEYVFPLLKGADLANGRKAGARFVLITQRHLGDDTTRIRDRAPRTWDYLIRHQAHFDARKSSIYRGQPAFAIFGIGDYTLAPYKIALCGLYKRLSFALLEPFEGKPVVVDDTSYFLPYATREEASLALRALRSELARKFFESRVFWDAKRPISKALLQSLSLKSLLRELGLSSEAAPPSHDPMRPHQHGRE